MKKKHKIALAIIMLSCIKLFAQDSFKYGYIITVKNDTIYGKIKDQSNDKNYISCLFKTSKETREYFPNELNEFGYKNSLTFKSKIVPNRFAQYLVRGRINLYYSKNMFHIEKNGEIFDLKEDTDSKEYEWQVLLSHQTSDCPKLLDNVIMNLNLNKEDLTNIIIDYNNYTSSEYKVFKDHRKKSIFEYGVVFGMNKSAINSKNGNYSYIKDNYIYPDFGLVMSISANKAYKKTYFLAEIHFSKSNYYAYQSINSLTSINEFSDSYIDLTTISIPLSVKYAFSKKKSSIYIQGGVNIDYHIKSDMRNYTEIINQNIVYGKNSNTKLEVNKTPIGLLTGIGFHKNFKHFRSEISLRYIYQLSKFYNNTVIANGGGHNFTNGYKNSFSINLILLKK